MILVGYKGTRCVLARDAGAIVWIADPSPREVARFKDEEAAMRAYLGTRAEIPDKAGKVTRCVLIPVGGQGA